MSNTGTPALSNPLKVAFTGTHGSGKTWIVGSLLQRLSGVTVERIESPTRYIKSLGYGNNENSGFQMQLLSGTQRVVLQKEALKKKPDIIVGDRCLADELAYNEYLVQFVHNGNSYEVDALNHTTHLLRELFVADVKEYWDHIFVKPLHPDFPPEDDGDRPTDLAFWRFIDSQILQTVKATVPELQFTILDPDREVALGQAESVIQELALNLI